MRWDPGHRSDDVIDRRGEGGGLRGGNILFAFLPLLLRSRFGLVILVIVGIVYFVGQIGGGTQQASAPTRTTGASNDKQMQFVSFVLDDVQGTFQKILAEGGRDYPRAKLVLFTGATQTGCGGGQAATGPFYCPLDQRVYIDLSFYDELSRRFGAKGDFAQAYVIAHEIGHHVQNLLGTSEQVQRMARSQQKGATGASVKLELQADCYAGVWAHSTARREILEAGDLDEALRAAASIGDDRLQREASGRVHPESWTHGSSEQRSRWLRRGFEQGKLAACDTFAAANL